MPSPPSLQAPRPLNCMLAGYFSRVMGSLLLRRTQDIMQYLQKHQELLLQVIAVRACTRPFPRPFTPTPFGCGSSGLPNFVRPRTWVPALSHCSTLQHLMQLVDHVDTTSIAEVLVRLVGADEQRAFLSTNHLQWLSGQEACVR